MEFELDQRLQEAQTIGVGFTVPTALDCSNCSKNFGAEVVEVVA